ncbi:MAG TPA: hypothetical protein VG737_14985 [Cyclobacteriaceae bacterium]|nr:hypothetical protein [Cyclobacteriaceae bacterium]
MKKSMLLLAAFVCALQVQAQFAVVNYMKVKPGSGDAFLANERVWKKLHQQRVNEGKMIAWEVFYVHGQGTESPYNYVTVDVYENMQAAFTDLTTDELKKAFGEKYADVLSKTSANRDLVYSDMFNRVLAIDGKSPDKFVRISFMSIKDNDKYYKMEEKAFKPIHQAAVDMGNLNAWSIWAMPFWNNTRYDAIAANGFTSVEQMAKMNYGEDVLKKGMASMKASEQLEASGLINETSNIRTMVISQLWELLESTAPKK